MVENLQSKKTKLHNSITRRKLNDQSDTALHIITGLSLMLTFLLGVITSNMYYTGQPLDDTLKTMTVDGKTVVFGTDNHTRLKGDTTGQAINGGNIMWIEAFRGEKNIEETCNHELLHLYEVPGGETRYHDAIYTISRKMNTEFCNKVKEKAGDLTNYKP